jgi:hypothetical protein
MKNIFAPEITQEIIDRIHKLTPDTQRQWGKMTVSQMLAHCSVTYEMIYEDIHPKPKGFQKLILKTFVKNIVISKKPYKPNNPTAPAFLIKEDKHFHKEQKRLTDYIQRTQQLGAAHLNKKNLTLLGN